MNHDAIHILGGGAIGAPLAAFLSKAGRPVILLRSNANVVGPGKTTISVHGEFGTQAVSLEEHPFKGKWRPGGWLVIAAKAHANAMIADELRKKSFRGTLVLLQNGIGVEQPFIEAGFVNVIRGVLYVTSQRNSDRDFSIGVPRPSRLGLISGPIDLLPRAVEALSTPEMTFVSESMIERWVWRKTIINAVFNSICTLSERTNRLFVESPEAMSLAVRVVRECVDLALRYGMELDSNEILDDIRMISGNSDQWISTLQDIKAGRPTEIGFINHAFARLAAAPGHSVDLTLTSCLGKLVMIKAGASQ